MIGMAGVNENLVANEFVPVAPGAGGVLEPDSGKVGGGNGEVAQSQINLQSVSGVRLSGRQSGSLIKNIRCIKQIGHTLFATQFHINF